MLVHHVSGSTAYGVEGHDHATGQAVGEGAQVRHHLAAVAYDTLNMAPFSKPRNSTDPGDVADVAMRDTFRILYLRPATAC